ncbi:MAG: hypothetical protein ABR968_11330 [Bacteroidales bacterium]
MLKKLLLSIVFVISGIILLDAQCTNITYTSPGLHPDTMRHAHATVLYGDTLTVIVPKDTTVPIFGTLPIDSVVLNSITGLPAGFAYHPSAHHWVGNTSGCIYFSGTPTHLEAISNGGIYPLALNFTGYSSIGSYSYADPDTLFIKNDTISGNEQCTNIIYTTSGLHPDSVRHGKANVHYGDTLTMVIPADTTIGVNTYSVDSIVFVSITGLPSGFTSTPSNHRWLGSSKGCILISGTPTRAEAEANGGIYPLVINFNGFGKHLSTPCTIPLSAVTSDTLIIKNDSVLITQCTNILYNNPGLHPDSVRHAFVNVLYGDTLTLVVPADTSISGHNVPIDSLVLTSIAGLPSGFTYTSNSHHWPASTKGCIFISGTPTYLEALTNGGIYPLVINFKGYGGSYNQAFLITSDTIKIKGASGLQCTNITYITSGLHPDSVRHGYVNVLYGDTLTMIVPADTNIGVTVSIDSIALTSITGLPSSITYHPNAHHWPGSSYGCIYLAGTPTITDFITQSGIYPLTINMYGWGKLGASPYSSPLTAIKSDTLVITNNIITGINDYAQNNGVTFFTRYDQSNNSVVIEVHSLTEINNASLIINDITGRELMRLNNLTGTDFIINKGNLTNGVYIISLLNNQKIIARGKVIIG